MLGLLPGSVSLLYLAIAFGHAPASRALNRRFPGWAARHRRVLRLLCFLCFIVGCASWPRSHGAAVAWCAALSAFLALACAYSLLEPIFPRVMWLLVGLAAGLGCVFYLTGGVS